MIQMQAVLVPWDRLDDIYDVSSNCASKLTVDKYSTPVLNTLVAFGMNWQWTFEFDIHYG